MKKILLFILPLFFVSCLFKFSGTDTLYYEGRKANPTLTIKRLWCSQCGCEAIEIKQMEKRKVITEMLLNCTEGCPPGEKSYKIEKRYDGDNLIGTKFYFLVREKYMDRAKPLSVNDSILIEKVKQFREEPFFKHYCMDILNTFKGYIQTDSSQIIRFAGR